MSFGTLCIMHENHNRFYQLVSTVTQDSYLFVSQKNKITKKMTVVYTVSELESSTGCICENISV